MSPAALCCRRYRANPPGRRPVSSASSESGLKTASSIPPWSEAASIRALSSPREPRATERECVKSLPPLRSKPSAMLDVTEADAPRIWSTRAKSRPSLPLPATPQIRRVDSPAFCHAGISSAALNVLTPAPTRHRQFATRNRLRVYRHSSLSVRNSQHVAREPQLPARFPYLATCLSLRSGQRNREPAAPARL